MWPGPGDGCDVRPVERSHVEFSRSPPWSGRKYFLSPEVESFRLPICESVNPYPTVVLEERCGVSSTSTFSFRRSLSHDVGCDDGGRDLEVYP